MRIFVRGLGKRMVKRFDKEFGVWVCVRDWNDEEQVILLQFHTPPPNTTDNYVVHKRDLY